MGTNVRQNIVTNGLAVHLDAGSRQSYPGSGTTWTDLSGNRYNGSLVNGPTYNSADQGSIVFDGVDDGVNCGNNFNLQFFTTTVWVQTTNSAGYNFLFSVGSYNSPIIAGWGLTANGTSLGYDHCSITTPVSYTLTDLYNGKWWQLGIYRDSSNGVGIIVNGTIVARSTYATSFTNSNLWLGQRTGGTIFSPFFKGNMACATVYNRGLSAQEILQNYNATKTRFGLS